MLMSCNVMPYSNYSNYAVAKLSLFFGGGRGQMGEGPDLLGGPRGQHRNGGGGGSLCEWGGHAPTPIVTPL